MVRVHKRKFLSNKHMAASVYIPSGGAIQKHKKFFPFCPPLNGRQPLSPPGYIIRSWENEARIIYRARDYNSPVASKIE